MRSLINLLRGIVTLTVQGPFPERLLNLCAQHRLAFWGLEWQDDHTIMLQTRLRDWKQLKDLAERIGCTVVVGQRRGLPFFLGRFRKRYGFLAGLTVSLVAVCVLSSFVFTVEVTGNETVPTAQILGELRRLGLRTGAYGPGLELKQIGQEALLTLEDLSWMTINLYGTRAEVIVREVKKPPEILDESGCWDIVAEADGLITQVEPLNGEALVKEGDIVIAGDILITGHVSMKPPLYSQEPVRYYQTHARGRIWATTWRTISARIPLETTTKIYTEEEKSQYCLTLLGHRIEFYRNSSISWPFYDKINTVYPLVLPGKISLPVFWSVQRIRAYEPQQVQVDRDAAQNLLEEQLHKRLTQLLKKGETVESTRFSAIVQDNWLTVTLHAQCQEEIGTEVPADYGVQGKTEENNGTFAP